MTFILVVAAALIAFLCGKSYSEWIHQAALDMQAYEIVRLKAEMRASLLENASIRGLMVGHITRAYAAGKKFGEEAARSRIAQNESRREHAELMAKIGLP